MTQMDLTGQYGCLSYKYAPYERCNLPFTSYVNIGTADARPAEGLRHQAVERNKGAGGSEGWGGDMC